MFFSQYSLFWITVVLVNSFSSFTVYLITQLITIIEISL